MSYKDTLCTNFIVKNKARGRYGSEAPSKLIPAEKGRSAIYVMSDGSLEQEEVDYLVEATQEKEDSKIRKSATKERLEQVVRATRKAPRGMRAEVAQDIIDGKV